MRTIKIDKKGGNWIDLQHQRCANRNAFNDNLGKYLSQNEYESLDVALYPMPHQIVFRQYNPKKPHHYGILCKSSNDARYPYTYKSVPYASKPKSGQRPYYIKSPIDYVKYLVTKIEEQQNLHGRNISTDRLYTSVELSKWLLTRNITTVGTVQKGRHGMPNELFDVKGREKLSVTCHYKEKEKHVCTTSYTVATKSKGKKNVVILSTMRPMDACTKDDDKFKLEIFTFYYFTKRGTDIVDQMNDFFTTCAKSNRWAMVVLYYMLDTTRANSKTLWCMKNKIDIRKSKTFDFTWQLANEFCVRQVSRRSTIGLSKMVHLKIQVLLSIALDTPIPKPRIERRYDPNSTRKKCHIHLQNCQSKSEKDKARQ